MTGIKKVQDKVGIILAVLDLNKILSYLKIKNWM